MGSILPTLIAAGTSAASALAGYQSSQANLKAQQQQNLAQNALNAQSVALAEKMNQQGLATQVDANGNITYYDAGTNTWRTILAPQQAQINDASNTEMLRQLSVDAPLARGEALRASQAKVLDQGTADTLRTQLGNVASGKGQQTAGDIASSLRLSRQSAVNAGFDQTQTALTTQGLRTGTGVQDIGANLARARADTIAQTMGNPQLEGTQAAGDMNATALSNAINNYGTVANQAYSTGGFSAPNPNITPTLSAAQQNSKNASIGATGAAAQSIGSIKVPAPATIPNYSSLIAGLGGNINSLYNSVASAMGSSTPTGRTVTAAELAGKW